jgi:dipeptidyl-peptidase 4
MFRKIGLVSTGAAVALSLVCAAGLAQHPRQYTDQDYANAERFMPYNMNPLAFKGQVKAQSLDDGRFWYKAVDDSGITYMVVDPAKRARGPAFDQQKVAAAINAASRGGLKVEARHLLLSDLAFSDGGRTLNFRGYGNSYRCDLGGTPLSCAEIASEEHDRPEAGHSEEHPPMTLSPDKKLGAFIRDWNLWVRNLATGEETQLTTDGVKDYGYATDNAGWKSSDAAILLWSPDSSRISARPAKCTWFRSPIRIRS